MYEYIRDKEGFYWRPDLIERYKMSRDGQTVTALCRTSLRSGGTSADRVEFDTFDFFPGEHGRVIRDMRPTYRAQAEARVRAAEKAESEARKAEAAA